MRISTIELNGARDLFLFSIYASSLRVYILDSCLYVLAIHIQLICKQLRFIPVDPCKQLRCYSGRPFDNSSSRVHLSVFIL